MAKKKQKLHTFADVLCCQSSTCEETMADALRGQSSTREETMTDVLHGQPFSREDTVAVVLRCQSFSREEVVADVLCDQSSSCEDTDSEPDIFERAIAIAIHIPTFIMEFQACDQVIKKAMVELDAYARHSWFHHGIFCGDIALVTSLRYETNLVTYECVACQDAKKGVVIYLYRNACSFCFQCTGDGFNMTLIEPADITRRREDQIKEMELKLYPYLKESLVEL